MAPADHDLYLRGLPGEAENITANRNAVGGMRNPAQSNDQLKGRAVVGPKVANIITKYLRAHPEVKDLLISSFGKPKGEAKAVGGEHIQICRRAVASFFNVNLNDDTPETELISPLFQAWAKMADDPDIPLTEWLRDGTPAGIEHDIEVVGVFPPSVQPPSQDFELTAYSEELKNYDSMEDSPSR